MTEFRNSETNEVMAWEVRRDYCVGGVHDVTTIRRYDDEFAAKDRVAKLFADAIRGFRVESAMFQILDDGQVLARVRYNETVSDSWWIRDVRVTQTVEWSGDEE